MCTDQEKSYSGVQAETNQQANNSQPQNDQGIRRKLLERKWKLESEIRELESEIREVENALNDLSDPTVQKVINVVTVSEKR